VHELEFLPQDYLKARFQRRIGFIRSWLLLALGLAMVLWSLQVGVWVRDAKAELQALRGTGSAVDPDVEKVRMLRAEGAAYSQRAQLAEALRPRVGIADALAALADLLPDGAALEDVCLDHPETAGPDRATVRLGGAATSEAVVTQTMAALEASACFERSVLVESRPLGPEEPALRQFIIETTLTGPAEGRE